MLRALPRRWRVPPVQGRHVQPVPEPARGGGVPPLPVGDHLDGVTGHVPRVSCEVEAEGVPGRQHVGALVTAPRPDEQVVPAVPFDDVRRLRDRHGRVGARVGERDTRPAPPQEVGGTAVGHDVVAARAGEFGVVHDPFAADPQHHRVTRREPPEQRAGRLTRPGEQIGGRGEVDRRAPRATRGVEHPEPAVRLHDVRRPEVFLAEVGRVDGERVGVRGPRAVRARRGGVGERGLRRAVRGFAARCAVADDAEQVPAATGLDERVVVEIAGACGGGRVVDVREGPRADPLRGRAVPGGPGPCRCPCPGGTQERERARPGGTLHQGPPADRKHGLSRRTDGRAHGRGGTGAGQSRAGPALSLTHIHSDQVANPVCHLW